MTGKSLFMLRSQQKAAELSRQSGLAVAAAGAQRRIANENSRLSQPRSSVVPGVHTKRLESSRLSRPLRKSSTQRIMRIADSAAAKRVKFTSTMTLGRNVVEVIPVKGTRASGA
jgi:hypothetical protein